MSWAVSPLAWPRRPPGCARRRHGGLPGLSQGRLYEDDILEADLVAFYVPMHTATRIAVHVMERVKTLNPRAHLCFYGLYAPMNEAYLRRLGAHTILGGSLKPDWCTWCAAYKPPEPTNCPARASGVAGAAGILVPDRQDLPLERYAHLVLG